ncbi:BspA family leucine-rich repeat surface protein [Campylobacter sp. 50012-21]|uniref:BspA family leucine-rich repeat surface protein n=1 Tax=Campylobacter magnus TaxID=3026462 RepID=UPI00235E6FE6|nr:BspA family leucine-rich repeat surface protein [Campylobacter magnus]MDD0846012.1 BspA family leucine-rich repeat surface protein [Campylobacter magnus]
MKYKPKNRDELEELIYDENICLGDIDTSLVDDMSDDLFSCRDDLKGISNWNVHNVACMVDIFMYRKYNENLDGWLINNPNVDKICNALFEQIGTKTSQKPKNK